MNCMSREVRFTVDDDQFATLEQLKDRFGYTWKGLMLESVEHLGAGAGMFTDRDRLEAKVDALREEFGDREHHSTIRISSVTDERSGEEHLGIRVMLMDTDHLQLASDLEDIDRSLYDDGYNTSWAQEKQRLSSDDTFTPEGDYLYEGATSALLIERGVPEIPDAPSPHREASTHQNIH